MKINFVKTFFAFCLSGLIAYGFYNFHDLGNELLLSIGSFTFIFITLVGMIGVRFTLPRTRINIQIVSSIFCAIALVANIAFSLFSFIVPLYVIVVGILILLYMLIIYSIYNEKL